MKDVQNEDLRSATLAGVETDDTSLAQAWIATEGGGDEDVEIIRASDGTVRRFDRRAGTWDVLDETNTRRRLSAFLCDVGDAKLVSADVKLREGEIDKKVHSASSALSKNLRSQSRLKAVWQMAMVHLILIELDDFDAAPTLLGTPAGVIDLTSGEIRPATVGDKVTQRTAVSPAPQGTQAPIWENFLSSIFDGNIEMIEFVQRMVGSALVGDVSPQKFVVLYGSGANGKSVLRDVCGRLAGSYATTASSKVFMQSYGDRHPTEIASLAGKRLVLASEVPTGRMWNDTLLKDLTGGEKISARRMHKDEFTFTPRGTLIFTANTLPSFPGAQEAMLRRILLVPMLRQFSESEQDPNLAAQLINEEGPAILGWMVEGARKFLADGGGVKGLRIPQSVIDGTRAYFDEEDIVLQFLMSDQSSGRGAIEWCCRTFIPNKLLFDAFIQWSDANGYKNWTSRTLPKAIRENAGRYGLSDARSSGARGFSVDRLLVAVPQSSSLIRSNARKATNAHLALVKNNRAKND